MDAHFVAFFTVLQPRYKAALRRRAHRDSQIFLAHHIIADDGVQIPQRGIAFSCQHQPLGAAVEAVAERRRKPLFGAGVIFTLAFQIRCKGINKIRVTGAVAVAEQMGRLVQHSKVVILIHHRNRGLLFRRLGRFYCSAARREKLIIDIHLNQVTGLQPGVRLGTLAIDLDALVAERLVHHAAGHVLGHTLDKTAQTNAVLIRSCGKTFHRILTMLIKQPAQFRAAVWL